MFKKGNKGGGRPRGSVPLATILKRLLEQKIDLKDPITKEQTKKEIQEALMLSLVGRGLKGDITAIKEIFERIDGKVPQSVQHAGDPAGAPIKTEAKVFNIQDRIAEMIGKK